MTDRPNGDPIPDLAAGETAEEIQDDDPELMAGMERLTRLREAERDVPVSRFERLD